MPASACGLPPISKVSTAIGLTANYIEMQRCLIWTLLYKSQRNFLLVPVLNQLMLSFYVPFGGPSCTVHTIDLKFLLFTLWDFCGYKHVIAKVIPFIELCVLSWFRVLRFYGFIWKIRNVCGVICWQPVIGKCVVISVGR